MSFRYVRYSEGRRCERQGLKSVIRFQLIWDSLLIEVLGESHFYHAKILLGNFTPLFVEYY